MKQSMQQVQTRRTFLALSIAVVSWGIFSRQASAEQRHDELPPRPQPINKDDETPVDKSASIQLWPTPVLPALWTVVQWRGGSGRWYDVEGWRGTLNQPAYISWRVEEKDFGKGPFRWVVYEGEGGTLLAISESFHLPSNNGDIFKVTLSIPSADS